jgi:DNA-binding NtrC family response regulator
MKTKATRVLIIDDDKTILSVVSPVLRAAGHQVITALDPVQGFMAARREKPNLILLDLMMPAGGGMQLLAKLAGGGAPVVVMTVQADPKVEAEARAHGAAEFLRKPLDLEALSELVQELVRP